MHLQVPLSTKLKKLSVVHKRGMHNFERMYKFIPMRGPEQKGFAEMAVWKGAVVQPRSSSSVIPHNHVSSGIEKVQNEEQHMDKNGPLDGKVPDSVSPIPTNQSSVRASGDQVQSDSEPRQSGEFSVCMPLSDSSSRIESSHLASPESSSEGEECNVKTETHKKGRVEPAYIINPRRACAARVTVLRLSVCLSVTTSLAHLAAKSLKFGHR